MGKEYKKSINFEFLGDDWSDLSALGADAEQEVTYLSANLYIKNDAAGVLDTQQIPNGEGLLFKGFMVSTSINRSVIWSWTGS